MILVINLCKEKLHYYEFVKPIEDVLNEGFVTKGYFEVDSKDLEMADKVIICGTSLRDNLFIEKIKSFEWIEKFEKPILGICAGFQVIGLIYGGFLEKKSEIGYFRENLERKFLGIEGEVEVYHLHQNYIDFNKLEDFKVYAGEKIPQAVKHKEKEIYGTLFHPEVRNKELIKTFARL